MAGLYVHIPFCASRCVYCGFYSTTLHDRQQRYVDALCREMDLRRDYLHEDVHTVYIGGGTPSLLTESQLQQIFDRMDCSKAIEITMECNPDDITDEYAGVISRLPINRVSMGAQTFNDVRLRFLRRRHNSQDISQAVERLRKAGIANISIDLMYGFPEETMSEWMCDIDNALALGVEHLSAYCLMFEEGTPLYRMLQQGKIKELDEELCADMYYVLIDRLAAAGYEHYEISNFSRPNRKSLHNSSYWTAVPYLGIGAAAHSFDMKSRQWNIADIDRYMASIERNEIPMERETLDLDTQYNDMVMLRLRTCDGIDIDGLGGNFSQRHLEYCLKTAQPHIDNGLLERTTDNRLRLTRKGLFVCNMVMSDMMMA